MAEKDDRVVCKNPGSISINVVEKQVSFTKQSRVIGEGSYEIDPDVDIKHTKNRPPTPTGSLTSVNKLPYVESLIGTSGSRDEDDDEDDEDHEFIAELPFNAKIYVEHLFVKFKRRVVKGVCKTVMECLCHFKETQEIMNKTDYLSKIWLSFDSVA